MACLVLSFLFWLLTTLSRTYIEDIPIPVNYTNLPENKVLVSKLPEQLFLEIEATGFDILWLKMNGVGDQIDLDASPSSLKRLPSADAGNYVLVTERKLSKIRSEIEEDVNLVAIRPDSIVFEFRNKVQKNLPVLFKGSLEYDGQYGPVGQISFDPSIIKVSGPAELLDTMKAIYTDSLVLESIDETVELTVNLEEIYSQTSLSFDSIKTKLTIPVEKFTEGTVDVPITQVGNYDEGTIKVFPTEVEVSYWVPLSQFENIQKQQFKVQVDLGEISKEGTSSLQVLVTDFPSAVKRVRSDPEKVEFIIQR
ncbi:MAG: hypothetical protein ACI85F_002756 [Bacteroidia bacterium]|jgi:hypothetical protein